MADSTVMGVAGSENNLVKKRNWPGSPEHLEKPSQKGLGKRAHFGSMNQVPNQPLQRLRVTYTLGAEEPGNNL